MHKHMNGLFFFFLSGKWKTQYPNKLVFVQAVVYRSVLPLRHEKNGLTANNWNMVHLHNLIVY